MEPCLVIRSKKTDDVTMRPGTGSPDKHWAFMLTTSVSTMNEQGRMVPCKGVYVRYEDGEITVCADRTVSSSVLMHISTFVKLNNLTYEFPAAMEECDRCQGNHVCLANLHKI